MMVTFVSQCEKKALNRTRRVLDAFADRIGDSTWQTVITQEGLNAVRKLLRKTASKNTAVSCHWIRSRSRTELVWVVGNRRKFDTQGRVPVNMTEANLIGGECTVAIIEPISLFSGIAGLFHDAGKANVLFQRKLDGGEHGKNVEPYRHEWVSLKIFQVFVGDLADKQWVTKLANINSDTAGAVIAEVTSESKWLAINPLTTLSPIAKIIAWLIVSHHRLPASPETNRASLSGLDNWTACFDAGWNAPRSVDVQDKHEVIENWSFPKGTPLNSVSWQISAQAIARALLNNPQAWEQRDWFNQRFVAHLSRLSLMLADHYYSSLPLSKSKQEWRDPNYDCYANTDQRGKKQKLDEHNIGVCENAVRIARELLRLKDELPSLESDAALMKSVPARFKEKFGWQDKAYDKAKMLSEETIENGFFGINMASTGFGKTRANARIMHALSGHKNSRFSIALGLRTLTLQTGDAMKKDLEIDEDQIAVLVGSQAVHELHRLRRDNADSNTTIYESTGSESAIPLIDDNAEISHILPEYNGNFSRWLKHDEKIMRLIQTPVLVSTVDYLVPATEGIRGGRQIAPMLRLLTSDLVLDEPDDFGLEDMPALCRLVNWAGMLGSKVLLSTASLPPALAFALFESYLEGRKHFVAAVHPNEGTTNVVCAWFDETSEPLTGKIYESENFRQLHQKFVGNRVTNLYKNDLQQVRGKIISVVSKEAATPLEKMRDTIKDCVYELHKENHVINENGKNVSVGVIRIANIKPLVALAKKLYAIDAKADYQVYYRVYHSQFPLIIRSTIEENLDNALDRHDERLWWNKSGIEELIVNSECKNHIFIVLATAVAEVGRDHDYDWAIAEPSSMRSIVQLGGRILRHRGHTPTTQNIHIISQNYKGLNGRSPAFSKPGFETSKLAYCSTDLKDLLEKEAYENITAIPRIRIPEKIKPLVDGKFSDFIGLEHIAHFKGLLSHNFDQPSANIWWGHNISWCAEAQLMQPFRQSTIDDVFCLVYSARTAKLIWKEVDASVWPPIVENTNKIKPAKKSIMVGRGVHTWFDIDERDVMTALADKKTTLPEDILWKNFTEIRLRRPKKEEEAVWIYHKAFGVYEELEEY